MCIVLTIDDLTLFNVININNLPCIPDIVKTEKQPKFLLPPLGLGCPLLSIISRGFYFQEYRE